MFLISGCDYKKRVLETLFLSLKNKQILIKSYYKYQVKNLNIVVIKNVEKCYLH